jgi:hypothetical protein
MKLNFSIIIIIIAIISLFKCDDLAPLEEEFDEDFYDPSKDVSEFKANLKDYLISNGLFDSDRLIERKEMKRIFLEIILDQNEEEIPDYLKGIIEFLTKHFMDLYYKKKKNEIRGRDIYDLIDILAISRKFQQLTGHPDYDDFYDDEEEEMNDIPFQPDSGL